MIENFTPEEINTIRNELKALDLQDQDKPKPHYLYRDELKHLFADRPESDMAIERILKSISKIADFTLDCMRFRYLPYSERSSYISETLVPKDVSDEYYEMYSEIIRIIEKHIKPYERFKKEEPDDQ